MRMRLLATVAAFALFAASAAPSLGQTSSVSPGTGPSSSTAGSLNEPAGVRSDSSTPSVYSPSGAPGVGGGTAGTGTSSSGALGNSSSPAMSPGGSPSSGSSFGSSTVSSGSSGALAPASSSATNLLSGTASGMSVGSIGTTGTGSAVIVGAPSASVGIEPAAGPITLPPSRSTGYIGAGYETSVGATDHFRMSSSQSDASLGGASRYEALARELREEAGDTGMADRNGSWVKLLDTDAELRVDPTSTLMSGDRGGK